MGPFVAIRFIVWCADYDERPPFFLTSHGEIPMLIHFAQARGYPPRLIEPGLFVLPRMLPMRFRSRLTALVALFGLCATVAYAAPPPGDAASIARFKAQLTQVAPPIAKDVLAVLPVDAMGGVYELDMKGNQVIYADPQARHLMIGSLIDLAAQQNLTQQRVALLSKFDFNTMPFKQAIREVRGNGQRKVAIFEDPNCHYCAQMETAIKDVTNVTIYHFLIPILGPDSVTKTQAIWCANDPAAAWHNWMTQRQAPTPGSNAACKAPLQDVVAFSQQHNVAGTPTVVFPDGTRVGGAMPRDAFETQLTTSNKIAR